MKLKLNKSLKLDKLLKNKAVLFITLVLFLTKHFSGNMIIILGVSIITTNLLDLFRVFSNKNFEGFKEGLDNPDTEEPPVKNIEKAKKVIDNKHTPDTPDNKHTTLQNLTNKKPNCHGENCKKPKKSAMTNIKPSALSEVNNSGPGNMDVFNDAKMKETAFDNLDKLLGSDNVRNLKGEANSLTMRQDKIMEQIKDVGPLMNQAMSLIKNIDMDAINNVTNKMGGMIDNLQQMKTSN